MKDKAVKDGFICLACPLGCELKVEHDQSSILKLKGNRCKIGISYAEQELFHPRRIVTTTVRILGSSQPLLPVRTREAVPKSMTREVVRLASAVAVRAPVGMGAVIISNVAETSTDLVASMSFDRESGI